VTAPDRRVLTNAEADYLLAAVVGMAQGLRLVPVAELAEHFEHRYQDARRRGDQAEKRLVLDELSVASGAAAFVRDVESLMDVRRNAALAEAELQARKEPEPIEQVADLPPSRRPLGDDDVWVTGPQRPAAR
jgi:hypothetical protein